MRDICRSPIERNLSSIFINAKRKELYKLSYWDESVDKLPATTGEILEVKIRKLLTRKQRLRRGRDEGWREWWERCVVTNLTLSLLTLITTSPSLPPALPVIVFVLNSLAKSLVNREQKENLSAAVYQSVRYQFISRAREDLLEINVQIFLIVSLLDNFILRKISPIIKKE